MKATRLPALLAAPLLSWALFGGGPCAAASAESALTSQVFFQIVAAEIALQRGMLPAAYATYLSVAKETQDAAAAKRATEIALQGRLIAEAVESSALWARAAPANLQAMQTHAILLVSTGKQSALFDFLRSRLTAVRGQPAFSETVAAMAQALQRLPNAQGLPLADRLFVADLASADVRLALAQLAFAAQDEARSIRELEQARALRGDDPAIAYSLGLLSLQQRRWAVAQGAFEQYLRQRRAEDPRDADLARLGLAEAYEQQALLAKAVEVLAAVEKPQQIQAAGIKRAQLLVKLRRVDEAIAVINDLLGREGETQPLVLVKAQLLREADRLEESMAVLEARLRTEPNNPDLLYDWALTAERLQRFERMEDALRQVMALQPQNPHAYNALGYSLADRNVRLNEAAELVTRALELAPGDPFIMDSMAWVHFRQGRLQEAEALLSKAYELRPDTEIGVHLAEVWWAMGMQDRARALWQLIVRRDEHSVVLRTTLKRLGVAL